MTCPACLPLSAQLNTFDSSCCFAAAPQESPGQEEARRSVKEEEEDQGRGERQRTVWPYTAGTELHQKHPAAAGVAQRAAAPVAAALLPGAISESAHCSLQPVEAAGRSLQQPGCGQGVRQLVSAPQAAATAVPEFELAAPAFEFSAQQGAFTRQLHLWPTSSPLNCK